MRPIRSSLFVAALAAAVLAAGCAGQKEPATKAVADVEASLSALRDDASKYAATELQSADAALASLKSSLQTGDYKSILAGAPALVAQVDTLRKTIADKKAEAEAALDSAVAGFDSIKAAWGEATAAATSGNFVEAMGKADAVKAKGAEVMAALGMTTSG